MLYNSAQLIIMLVPSRIILTAIVAYRALANPLLTITTNTQSLQNLTSGRLSVLRTYEKFGATVPREIKLTARGNTGSVTVTPTQYDAEYLLPAQVGPPSTPKTYQLSLDTGSSSFIVYSTTSQTLSETVTIGSLVVASQTVQFSAPDGTFGTTDSNGILGLAFSNAGGPKTFFENVAPTLAQSLFTVNLKKGKPGTLTFGAIDTSQYTGTITYVPVKSSNGFWEITSSGYAIGSSAFVTYSIDAVVDTGTTLLYLPAAVVKAYYAKVSGATNSASEGGYVFPCTATLPSITLGIGAYRGVTPGNYLNYAPVDTGSTTCFGGIQADTGIGFSIFGDIFIKSQFLVFKGPAQPMLGFAAKPV